MSRCYPFPPPGYEKKAPQLSADIAQPHKDKKDRHKHKDKKKKKKKDGDTNGDTHDKDSSRPSKQPRTVLINDLLQPKEEKLNGIVRNVLPTAATERSRIQSTTAVEASLVVEVRDGGKTSARSMSERTSVIPPVIASVVAPPVAPSQPLYSKQELNGKVDATPVLVLPPESSSSEPSSRPGGSSNQPTLPSNNLDSQRQSPKAAELPTPACEMLVLKQPSTWADVPDEDWLFAGKPLGSHPKPKAEVERGAGEPSVQVWAEAVYLPSQGIYALPYVVPY